MRVAALAAIVNAVLYEGYLLYPYRPSSIKNRNRWTFGGVSPREHVTACGNLEPWFLETQLLVEGGASTRVEVRVRFLHLLEREGDGWQEAVEREVVAPPFAPGEARSVPFAFAGGRTDDGIVRHHEGVSGSLELSSEAVAPGVFRLHVRVANTTAGRDLDSRQALLRSFASTNTLLGVTDGAFVSAIDPPPGLAAAAAACKSQGTWPVLVGDEGSRDTVLSSPIILYDYPRTAPESPGDLYDGAEIDEILSLRIRTLSEAERLEVAGTDARARALLERTEALSPAELGRLHGTLRRALAPGDRVTLRPRGRGDVLDLALAGKTARIEAIEQDYENRTHLAVTIEDDPGQDLGAQGKPGHRFFFHPDEVERAP
jgi:hypothetical protein